jgi:hypothetical protein
MTDEIEVDVERLKADLKIVSDLSTRLEMEKRDAVERAQRAERDVEFAKRAEQNAVTEKNRLANAIESYRRVIATELELNNDLRRENERLRAMLDRDA